MKKHYNQLTDKDRHNPQRQSSQRNSGGQQGHIGYSKKQIENPEIPS